MKERDLETKMNDWRMLAGTLSKSAGDGGGRTILALVSTVVRSTIKWP
jgi:hypothetical protein